MKKTSAVICQILSNELVDNALLTQVLVKGKILECQAFINKLEEKKKEDKNKFPLFYFRILPPNHFQTMRLNTNTF